MTVETVQVNGTWLNEVSYNTKTMDMTLVYVKGESVLYVDVPHKVFTSLKELADSKVKPKELENYIVKALTTEKRGAYVGRGVYIKQQVDKYVRIELNEPDVKAENLVAEYVAKTGKTLTVAGKYSTSVSKVKYDDKALYITYRNGGEYSYPDTPSVVKALFDEFVSNLSKIKGGGEAERTKYSLGKLANFVNTKHSKPKK